MKRTATVAAFGLVFGLWGAVQAAEVTVKQTHLCCPACVKGVQAALKDVKGVSDVAADVNSKTVSFQAQDAKAAQAGIKALAEAGFFGKATHEEKELAFPDSGAKKGAKADKVVLTGLHLCCGACVKGVQEALQDLDAAEIQVDRNAGTATVIGTDLDVSNVVDELNKGGFYGKVKK